MTPLLVSSAFSFHFGPRLPGELCRAAAAAGHRALALCDRAGVYGIPEFEEAARDAGIRPILGARLDWGAGRLVMLAEDHGGFGRITRLLTERAAERDGGPAAGGRGASGGRGAGAGPAPDGGAAGGRRAASPPRAGRGPGAAAFPLGALDRRLAAELLEEAPPGLVLLCDDPGLLDAAPPREGLFALLSPLRRRGWRSLLGSGHRTAASGEVAFLEPRDREIQRLLVAIGRRATVHDIGEEELSPPGALLVGPEEGARPYRELPEALAANGEIAERCRLETLFRGFVFPRYATSHPGGAAGLLAELVVAGVARRYGAAAAEATETALAGRGAGRAEAADAALGAAQFGALAAFGGAAEGGEVSTRGLEASPAAVAARAAYELGIIEEKGFSDYFLVVRDIVGRTSRTCGRGSAAASLVAYALGITDVEPLAHGLYFERFLNPGRRDPPDIDVDFAWDERDAIIDSVVREFGEERCARVANHVRFRTRSALREAARAHGMPDAETSAFEEALSGEAEAALAAAEPAWRAIAEEARAIAGLPRHLGTHSGGIVVSPGPLAELTSLERTGSGIRVVAWEKDGAESAGLVKIDLLGNRSLAVVRDALAAMRDAGEAFDEEAWRPLEDGATEELLARGDTMGVFYVESPAMRQLQAKAGRGDFAHLVIHSSIIRPAANAFISEYVDRLNGKAYEPLHPLLDGLLDETHGIMCYQEDVCKAAVALAGFTPAEADGIRKALSKKDASARLEAHEAAFRAGAAARGVAPAVVDAAWAMIESFKGYSFVKAHSASYAMLSFRSAWLRAHRPAEFMAAVISNRGGYYSVLAYASEARRMGLRLLPPDANLSEVRCSGRGGELRFGLGMIGGLSARAAGALVAERAARGPFASLAAFVARCRGLLDRGEAEALVEAGALDGLAAAAGEGRAAALRALLEPAEPAERDLFDGLGGPAGRRPRAGASGGAGEAPAGPAEDRLGDRDSTGGRGAPAARALPAGPALAAAQLRRLGTSLELHPLALWPEASEPGRIPLRDLPRHVGRRVRVLAWPVTAKEVLALGEDPMEFVSLEDEGAIVEAVLFPEAYARYASALRSERPVLAVGRAALDRGALSFEVERIEACGPPRVAVGGGGLAPRGYYDDGPRLGPTANAGSSAAR